MAGWESATVFLGMDSAGLLSWVNLRDAQRRRRCPMIVSAKKKKKPVQKDRIVLTASPFWVCNVAVAVLSERFKKNAHTLA